ncbi:MAG: CDP-diacylglycerol--glycerol-3-phosphate 3-phosphatidyltransferase [Sphaerochaeta sp.]|jgi:CDP-diacylglycerol--glycerol-3-phosphate 3-phosphatidyltransferase|nr:CDP-diacylglycerol--glycerol-3-phosphate 3-phosphatidyltransferase [Sphaerochaeta sp.]
MTLPNKLTVVRLVLSPVFFIVFNLRFWIGQGATDLSTILCLVLFCVIELTDLLDGKIARKRHLVTDLGKVMDPFGDTLAHLTYFVCFMMTDIMPSWVFVIIMYREFSILFIRMLMISQGKVMPANMFGKAKTVTYAASGVLGILYLAFLSWMPGASWLPGYFIALTVVFVLCAAASLFSFVVYVSKIHKDGSLSRMTR